MVVDSATAASRVKIMASASSSSSAESAHALVLSMPERARIICCQLRAEGAHGESSAWDGERSGDVGVARVFALLYRCDSLGSRRCERARTRMHRSSRTRTSSSGRSSSTRSLPSWLCTRHTAGTTRLRSPKPADIGRRKQHNCLHRRPDAPEADGHQRIREETKGRAFHGQRGVGRGLGLQRA